MKFNQNVQTGVDSDALRSVQESCEATMRFACQVINDFLDANMSDKELRRIERMLTTEKELLAVIRKMKSMYGERGKENNQRMHGTYMKGYSTGINKVIEHTKRAFVNGDAGHLKVFFRINGRAMRGGDSWNGDDVTWFIKILERVIEPSQEPPIKIS